MRTVGLSGCSSRLISEIVETSGNRAEAVANKLSQTGNDTNHGCTRAQLHQEGTDYAAASLISEVGEEVRHFDHDENRSADLF